MARPYIPSVRNTGGAMQPRKAPRKCAWCRKEIPEGVPFDLAGDRPLHVPCSNDLELFTKGKSTLFTRRQDDRKEPAGRS
jgi:hypothetical protein